MAKSPAFRLYVGDFLVGTMHLSTEQIGAYVLLLLHQWDQGHIPDDQDACARIARCQASTVASIWHKFGICQDGKRRNPRMETERDLQLRFREKQAANGSKRWKNSGGNAKPEPSLSGGNAKPEPSLSGGNAKPEPSLSLRGQCLSFSSSLSEVPLSSPEGDNTNPVTSLTESAEKKEGGRIPAARIAADAALRILAMFPGATQLSAVSQGQLHEHVENGTLPADEKKWRALEAMRAERAEISGTPDDFDLRAGWLISKERLCRDLAEALDTAHAKRPQASPGASTGARGNMTTPPADDWHARACKRWPDTEIPAVWTDLPVHIRIALIA